MGYRNNDKVEIYGENGVYQQTYFEAKIIHRVQLGLYRVEYKDLLDDDGDGAKVEDVWENRIRALPYTVVVPQFIVGDEVEAKYNGGWWIGVVSSINLPSYGVRFQNYEHEAWYTFDELRIHQTKIGRTWTYNRELMAYGINENVEICSVDFIFKATFYEATIMGHISPGLYVVRYKDKLNNNGERRLEEIWENRIRPVPYQVIIHRFKLEDEVDVKRNDGWWKGVVSSRLGNDYGVRLDNIENELWFNFNDLRVHQSRSRRSWDYVKY